MVPSAQASGVGVGGSGIEDAPVDLEGGCFAAERTRIPTPEPSTSDAVADAIARLLDGYDVPGSAPAGVSSPAHAKADEPLDFMTDLGQSWAGVDVTELPSDRRTGRPLAVINAAAHSASQQRARRAEKRR